MGCGAWGFAVYSFANDSAHACVEVFSSHCLAILCREEEQIFKWQRLAADFLTRDSEIQVCRKKAEQEADVAMAIKLCRILGDNCLFF